MVVAWLLLTPVVYIAVLTGVGADRRGASLPVAVVGAVFFPLTWAWWYVRDEEPYARSHHHE